jgi:prepilin-type N-terminal cleavage/methylation domain-containing protein
MRARGDDGFTLVETLTSLAVIGVVMSAVTTYFVKTMTTIDVAGARQAAVQVAADAMEQLRQVPGALAADWLKTNAVARATTVNTVTYTSTWSSPDLTALLLSATVTVKWPGRGCPAGGCSYAVTTNISTSAREPIFQSVN